MEVPVVDILDVNKVSLRALNNSIIVRKLSPFRTDISKGGVSVVNKKFDPHAGFCVMAEILDSRSPLYPVGDRVIIRQTGTGMGGAGFGPIEHSFKNNTIASIGGKEYDMRKESDRMYFYLTCRLNDPMAVVHWDEKNLTNIVTPVNKNYLVAIKNPMVKTEQGTIILPAATSHTSSMSSRGVTSEGTIIGRAADAEGDCEQGDKVILITQSFEVTAINSALNEQEYSVIWKDGSNKWFVPAGFYKEEYQVDIRTTSRLHMCVPFTDFNCKIVLE